MTTSAIGAERIAAAYSPWTLAGGPDPDVDEVTRHIIHALLTDPDLATRYRRHHAERRFVSYDEMVRALGYVWDCRFDDTANATGYCCGGCGGPQSVAGR
jgi:hypothetical protein